jgi:hypothetical protein
MSRWLLAVAGALLAAGVVAGFVPVSAAGVSCGSAFHASDSAQVADYSTALTGGGVGTAGASCDSKRSTWTVVAWMLLAPGLLLAGGGFVAWVRENP